MGAFFCLLRSAVTQEHVDAESNTHRENVPPGQPLHAILGAFPASGTTGDGPVRAAGNLQSVFSSGE